MTHTPGPWETSPDAVPDGWVQITVYEESTGTRVATAFESEANAKLIAAAPDLLEALQGFIDQANKVKGFPQAYEPYIAAIVDAKAAIAKAQS